MTTQGGGWTVVLWREPIQLVSPEVNNRNKHDVDEQDYGNDPRYETHPTKVHGNNRHEQSDAENYDPLRPDKHPSRPNDNDLIKHRLVSSSVAHPPDDSWLRRRRESTTKLKTKTNDGTLTKRSAAIGRKRIDRESFNRTWDEYKSGFGHLVGEHWLGKCWKQDIYRHFVDEHWLGKCWKQDIGTSLASTGRVSVGSWK